MKIVTSIIVLLLFNCIVAQTGFNLSDYNFGAGSAKQIFLGKQLDEISGLTIDKDLRVYCHDDEFGFVFRLNINSGVVEKKIKLGDKKLKEDFEDITVAGEYFYIVNSGGDLFKFKMNVAENCDYEKISTGLSRKYDVEGLCFDVENNSLLLACKEYAGKQFKHSRAIYEYSLVTNRLLAQPRFVIPIKEILKKSRREEFNPSAIERHPVTGNFLILDGKGKSIAEITDDGKIINVVQLDLELHRQPEGLAILPDNRILISDEAAGEKATLTFYSLKK